jgi:hypothetical protein
VGPSVDSGPLFFFCDPNGRLSFARCHALGRWQKQPRRVRSITRGHGLDAGYLRKDALPNINVFLPWFHQNIELCPAKSFLCGQAIVFLENRIEIFGSQQRLDYVHLDDGP